MRLQPSPQIERPELATALFRNRDYLRQYSQQHGNGTLAVGDDPFDSTKKADVRCLLTVESGPRPAPRLAYEDLENVVQGLMDYTFYPFKTSIASLSFAIYHASEGFIGTRILTINADAHRTSTS